MKSKIFTRIVLAILLVPILSVTGVFAVTDASTNAGQTDGAPAVVPADSESGLTAAERLQKLNERNETRKTARAERLTAAQELRLKERCEAAQTNKLSAFQKRAETAGTSRTRVHANIVAKLDTLVVKVEAAGVDTTDLQANIVVLKSKIADFGTKLTTYNQALKDIATMDCAGDVEAFKAALEEARTLHSELRDSASDIRTYVNDTIKPALQAIRLELAALDTTNITEGQ